jgi:WD40-like Beta Propeller Repeat
MTLPFRRRHNDAEATHDRARALSSRRLLEPLDTDEDAWLQRHLAACAECRREDDAFAADRELLRSLRDTPIEPPRDLWAKTAAALDVASSRRPGSDAARPSFWRTVPRGAAAGLAVLVVVLGTVLLPGILPSGPGPVAVGSAGPGGTPITVAAAPIQVLRHRADNTFDFVSTDVDAVCPHARPECVPPPAEHETSSLSSLGVKASTVTLSPNSDQVVFESGAATEGKIVVQPVATTPEATAPASPAGESSAPSIPPGSAGPTPAATPAGQIEIASGVTIVGAVAYSSDGKWLAFSAAPKDGSAGPDLYIYATGGKAAKAVTSDHQSYFSTWIGSRVLASRITPADVQAPGTGNTKESGAPGASGKGNNGQNNGQGNGQGKAIEGRATSFLFDPGAGTSSDLRQGDVWMPVVDPKGRFVAYWSGSMRSTDGVTWQLGDGQLVLDGWVGTETAPEPSAPSQAPGASAPANGPAGHPMPIVTTEVQDFVAKFDPDGIRLAVWVSESADGTDGRLHLMVIDPSTGTIAAQQPLPGEPALRRFSIGANRLAWVSPPGQDGHESTLQVLGWSGNTFGQIESEPGADLLILQ